MFGISLVLGVWCLVIFSMIESATGLILRTRPLTETSLIVQWLTPNFGRIATVAKGARRNKSPFAAKLDLFLLADFSFSRSRRSDLHTLREVSVRKTHAALRNELGWLRQASYAAALIEQTTETETPLPAIFDLMKSFLEHLSKQPPQPKTIFSFEMKLLRELGLAPNLLPLTRRDATLSPSDGERDGVRGSMLKPRSKLNPGTAKILGELTKLDWPALGRLKPSAAQSREIKQFLHGFLIYHLGKIPRGRFAALGDEEANRLQQRLDKAEAAN